MSWGRIDDDWNDHPKCWATSRQAQGTFWAMVSYANKYRKRRGLFDAAEALRFARNEQGDIAELVKARLLDQEGDGYRIHDFEEYESPFQTPEQRSQQARVAANAKHNKNGTAAPDCSRCRRNHRRCPDHPKDAGTQREISTREHPVSTLSAPSEHPAAPASTRKTPAECGVAGALPVPSRPVPAPTPTKAPKGLVVTRFGVDKGVGGVDPVAGQEQDGPVVEQGEAPAWSEGGDRSSWEVTASLWREAPLSKDKKGNEDSVGGAKLIFFEKINAKNWERFYKRLQWAVARRQQGQKFSFLYSFIDDGEWKSVQPPAPPAPPSAPKFLHPDA